jgi:hypothetical protein
MVPWLSSEHKSDALLPSRKAAWSMQQSTACHLLHAGFLLALFFDPEDGGDMFLQNIS